MRRTACRPSAESRSLSRPLQPPRRVALAPRSTPLSASPRSPPSRFFAVHGPTYGRFPVTTLRRAYSIGFDSKDQKDKGATVPPEKSPIKTTENAEDDGVTIRLRSIDENIDEDAQDHEADLVEVTKAEKSAALRADINLQGGEYFRLGMYDEAEAAFNKVLEMIEEELGAEHVDVATVLNNLAMVQANKGALDEALASLQRCLAVREVSLGAADESLVTPLNNLGLVCKRRKEFDQAYEYFDRALTVLEALRLHDDMQFGTILNNAASVRHQQGRTQDARDLLRRAAEVMTTDHPEVNVALGNLFFIERELKDYQAAAETGERLLGVFEENEVEAPARVRLLLQVADVNASLGQRSKALKLLEQAKALEGPGGSHAADIARRVSALS